ncbi:MAG: ribbon-helix-helix protein, CopG family [Syntrophobacteraceae bacterium]
MGKDKQRVERRQTGVKLDSELLHKFKVLAAQRETTLGELIEEAMKDYLQNAQDWEEK